MVSVLRDAEQQKLKLLPLLGVDYSLPLERNQKMKQAPLERHTLKTTLHWLHLRKERIFGPLQNLFLSVYELELSRNGKQIDSSSSKGI